MNEKTLLIAILVAIILLWAAETLNMRRTAKLVDGALGIGLALLK